MHFIYIPSAKLLGNNYKYLYEDIRKVSPAGMWGGGKEGGRGTVIATLQRVLSRF